MPKSSRMNSSHDLLSGAWSDVYPMVYEHYRSTNAAKRKKAAQRLKKRFKKKMHDISTDIEENLLVSNKVKDRLLRIESRRSAVHRRLTTGFVYSGGAVGGQKNYMRAPFIYRGLVSSQHPILEFFVSKTPRARRLMSGHNKRESLCTDSKLLALDCAYVESNKAVSGVIRVEIDTVWPSWNALGSALEDIGAPMPNIAVAHVGNDGKVHRPHLMWLLADSVSFTEKSLSGPRQAWFAAQRALVALLLPLGADPGGMSNSHRHKNPLSPLWSNRVMAPEPYALRAKPLEETDKSRTTSRNASREKACRHPQMQWNGECGPGGFVSLLDALPDRVATMQAFKNFRGHVCNTEPDHPDALVNAGSNRIWNGLCQFARNIVIGHRDGSGSRTDYDLALEQAACRLLGRGYQNSDQAMEHVLGLAAKTGEWTWKNWRRRQSRSRDLTADEIVEKQVRVNAARDRAAQTKCLATLQALIEAARALGRAGILASQNNVAKTANRSRRTTQAYWTRVLDGLAKIRNDNEKTTADLDETLPWVGAIGASMDKKQVDTRMAQHQDLPSTLFSGHCSSDQDSKVRFQAILSRVTESFSKPADPSMLSKHDLEFIITSVGSRAPIHPPVFISRGSGTNTDALELTRNDSEDVVFPENTESNADLSMFYNESSMLANHGHVDIVNSENQETIVDPSMLINHGHANIVDSENQKTIADPLMFSNESSMFANHGHVDVVNSESLPMNHQCLPITVM